MRWLVLILFVCCSASLKANTYYFSTLSGDDSRSALQAQEYYSPWKTIDKLNTIIATLSAGDSVLFKAGEVFYGSINITVSGSSNLPVVFSSYGSGAKPVITGLTLLKDWVSTGNGIWEASSSLSVSRLNTLLLNGNALAIGRYPNSSTTNKGYLTIESAAGNTQITDLQLPGQPNFTGGEVVIRKARWIIDKNVITQHSGNTINYTSESGYNAAPRFGYFIQNHPSTLDVAGEWYFRLQDKKVGFYSPSANPSSSVIEASTAENLVTCYNQNYIVFTNLSFKGANANAFDIRNAQSFRITNCDIRFSGINAINIGSTNNFILENSSINHTNNNGLNGVSCTNAVVRNNSIVNTGMVAGMGKGGDGNYEAIVIDGDNETIELNVIDSTGYVPVTFRGNNNIIRNNFISNFTLVKDDGGGIYTWNNVAGAPVNHGTKVTGNIVINGKGAGEGTDNPSYLAANGIYMDDGTANGEIIGNTVAGCALQGIYIHNAHDLVIAKNTFYNNQKQLGIIEDSYAPNSNVRNLRMLNNILFSKESTQIVAEFDTDGNDINQFGTIDSNFYCRPVDDSAVINVNYKPNGNNINKLLTLEQWKALFGKDQSTKKSPFNTSSTDFLRFEYNSTGSSKKISLDGTYADVKNNTYSGIVTLDPFSSVILLKKTEAGDTSVPESTCEGLGSILREQWNNIPGITVSDIPLQKAPDSKSLITSFEGPTNMADNYGSRVRGYICPPVTGNYTFLISSDDASELWLSTDGNPLNKAKIAFVSTWTQPRQWYKFPSQKSTQIYLVAGNKYYIEALQKEGYQGDNLAVAWQLPNGNMEAPVPGKRLSPYIIPADADKADQTITFASLTSHTFGSAPFSIKATASSGLPVSFRVVSGSATVSGNTVSLSGTGTVVIEASQGGNENYNAATSVKQSFTVMAAPVTSSCSNTGTILYEQWNNVEGNNLEDVSFFQSSPDNTSQLSIFEEPSDIGESYGSRMRGYICPPQSGNYTFWIAGDDACQLWLSTNSDPANKVKISEILSWSYPREWNKYPSQKSAQVYLQAGQRYYIEALHKQGGGGDNMAVAWQLPEGTMEAPINGNRLLPFTSSAINNNARYFAKSDISADSLANSTAFLKVYPNPFNSVATIKVASPESGTAKLEVLDLQGRLIKILFNGKAETAMPKIFEFKETGLADGMYIIRYTIKSKVLTKKITLVK